MTFDGELSEAFAPQAVTLTLTDEIDVSRGDMLVRPGNVPRIEPRFEAMVVWMAEEPLEVGKPYLFKHTTKIDHRRPDGAALSRRRQHAAPPGSRLHCSSTKSVAAPSR